MLLFSFALKTIPFDIPSSGSGNETLVYQRLFIPFLYKQAFRRV